ncbi:Tetratricopeptide-like helical protein [Lasiodiplodia theobromae]|uniref:Tetratricopeptide-like helical protein n=1 Tax=Lasiodiplodia theobromae TaxID=45133 RepID=UPI0015C3FC11|nr:Tetratricopeptide-like helical protein [Lasiodiplodia theobromae]KAF4539972.1 Tetratricopeptide-like helical protein [Lasiodiplodia theobromae]
MAEHPRIAAQAKAVADCFHLLVDVGLDDENLQKSESTDMDDQLARFNIWASNIGVFASGHASLDYRLRDSPEAKTLMIQLLEGLQWFLKRGSSTKHDRRYVC